MLMNVIITLFNKNVAIGSGIIGLGSVAANMGVIPYLAFNVVVVAISIFTLVSSLNRFYVFKSVSFFASFKINLGCCPLHSLT